MLNKYCNVCHRFVFSFEILIVRNRDEIETRSSWRALSNCVHSYFTFRFFENGPLEPGFVNFRGVKQRKFIRLIRVCWVQLL